MLGHYDLGERSRAVMLLVVATSRSWGLGLAREDLESPRSTVISGTRWLQRMVEPVTPLIVATTRVGGLGST